MAYSLRKLDATIDIVHNEMSGEECHMASNNEAWGLNLGPFIWESMLLETLFLANISPEKLIGIKYNNFLKTLHIPWVEY
jgi:hypothetical protein